VTGAVTLKTFHGPLTRVEVAADGQRWLALLPSAVAAACVLGEPVSLVIPPDACHVISRDLPPPPQPPLPTVRRPSAFGRGERGWRP
jgi:hypothetical protein